MDGVRKNIGSLGGTVEIDSVEGCGMTVRMRLPLASAVAPGSNAGPRGFSRSLQRR